MGEAKKPQDDSGEGRILDERETTALVLADLAYEDSGTIEAYGSVGGFVYDTVLNEIINETLQESGIDPSQVSFQASIFSNPDTGEAAIAYTGTNPTLFRPFQPLEDIQQDVNFVTGNYVAAGKGITQQAVAVEYTAVALSVLKDREISLDKITATGHSLGGGNAQLGAAAFGLDGAIWNAPGVSKISENPEYQAHIDRLVREDYPELIDYIKPGSGELISYREVGDLVSDTTGPALTGRHVGVVETHELDNRPGGAATSNHVLQTAGLVLKIGGLAPAGAVLAGQLYLGMGPNHKLGVFYDSVDPSARAVIEARRAVALGEVRVIVDSGIESPQPTLYVNGIRYQRVDGQWASSGGIFRFPVDEHAARVLDAHLALSTARAGGVADLDRYATEYLRSRYGVDHAEKREGDVAPVLDMDLDLGPRPRLEMDLELSGELPDALKAIDTFENRAGFAASPLNPLSTAAIVEPFPLTAAQQAAYDAAYADYLRAVDAADETRLLNLNVSGNANAPGYHGPYTGLPDTVDNDAANGGFAGFGVVQQEADNPGSTGWESMDPWRTGVLDNDASDTPYVTLDERMEANNPGSSGRSVLDGVDSGEAVGVAMALYNLDRLIELGDTPGAVAAGAQLVDALAPDAVNDTLMEGLGRITAAANLVRAIDGGDNADILLSSVVAAEQFGLVAMPQGVPVAGYLRAVMLAMDGETEMAAVSAASAWLSAAPALGPWGVAAGVLVQLVGAELFSRPDPRAKLTFTRGEDGAIDYTTRANETGGALEDLLAGDTGSGLAALMADYEALYASALEAGRIDVAALPVLALVADDKGRVEWRLEGGRHLDGAIQVLGEDPTGEDLARALRDTMLLTHVRAEWQSGAGYLVDPVSGARVRQTFYAPLGFTGDNHTSRAIGTGVFAGGGNVGGDPGLRLADASTIRYHAPPAPSVTRQLAQVTATWQVDRGAFAGEQGQLLALAIGAGLVDLATAVEASVVEYGVDERSVFEHGRTIAGTAESDSVVIAGAGVVARSAAVSAAGGPVGAVDRTGQGVHDQFAERQAPGEAGWLRLIPDASPFPGAAPVGTAASGHARNPRVGDPDTAASADRGADAGSELKDHAALIRDLAASGQGTVPNHAPMPVVASPVTVPDPHDASVPRQTAPVDDTGPPPVPIGARLSVVEDRFLVTDAERLLSSEAPGATLLDLGSASHGMLARESNGDIRFVPDPDYHGAAGFSYRIRTADGAVETRRAAVDVTAVNDRPDAVDDWHAAVEDGRVELDTLLLNDADVDGDGLRIVAVGAPTAGAVTGDAQAGFTYLPELHFHGEVQLTYVVADGGGAKSVARATLVIAEGANDAPEVAYAVVASGVEERPVTLRGDVLLAHAVDPEGDPVALADVRALAGGEVVWDATSDEIAFIPDKNFHGTARLAYTVTDAAGNTTRAEAGIAVHNQADPLVAAPVPSVAPLVVENGLTILPTETVLGQLSIDNPDGGEVRIVAARGIDGEAGRAVRIDDGSVAWYGMEGYTGPAVFEVRLSNGDSRTTARVDVLVEAPGVVPEGAAREGGPVPAGESIDDQAPSGGESLSEPTSAGTEIAAPTGPGDGASVANTGTGTESGFDTETGASTEPAFDVTLPGVEDQSLMFHAGELLDGDSASGAVFRKLTLSDPTSGRIEFGADRRLAVFTPVPDRHGSVALDYVVETGGDARAGRANLNLAAVDDVPRVIARDYKEPHFNLDEDAVSLFSVEALTGQRFDADGEPLSLAGARMNDPANGRVSITADGQLRFEPAADLSGDLTFEVDVTDGVTTVSAPMTVRVWPVNDAPRTVDDHAAALEETPLRVDLATLLANDNDIDGEHADLRLVGVWAAAGGSAALDVEAGQLVFTPAPDAHGAAWVDSVVEDRDGAFSVSRLHIDIANTYDPARAVDDTLHVDEDQTIVLPLSALTANDHNPDGAVLAVAAVDDSGISHGGVALTAEGLRVTPERDWHGEQTFTYTLIDGEGATTHANVTLFTDPVNDAPVAASTTLVGAEDTPVVLDADDLAARASDAEDDWTWVTALSSPDGDIAFDPATGGIVFTPNAHLNRDLNGGPLVLAYQLADEGGASADGVVYFDLAAVNDVPDPRDDVVLAWKAGPGGYRNPIREDWLLANDIEHDGETLSIEALTALVQPGAVLGREHINGVPTVYYRAADGHTGEDTFTYTVSDGVPGSVASARVAIHVLDNRAPVARDIATGADEDTVLVFDAAAIAAHVDDPDRELAGMPETLRVVEVGGAVNGGVELDAAGNIVFTPAANYNSVENGGIAGFDFVVEDIVGNRAGASASIVYAPVNDAPLGAGEHLGNIDEDSAGLKFTSAQLLANDRDIEGEALAVTGVRATSGGQVRADGEDVWRFVPDENFNGQGRIVYTVSDGALDSDVVSTLTVRPVNDRPIVEYDTATGYDNGTRNTVKGVLSNDTDVDGDSLSIGRITGTSSNVVVREVNGGSIVWEATRAGSGYIRYEVRDGHGGMTESRLDLSIAHKAVPPVFVGYTQVSYEGTYVNVPVHTSNGGSLTVTARGHVNAWDADGSSGDLRYYAGSGLTMTSTGAWSYTHTFRLQENEGGPGNWVTRDIATSKVVSVVDGEGNIASMSMPIRYTAHIQMDIQGKPVVLDLDGDGAHLVAVDESDARFDWNGDGVADRTGWIAGDGDALLAYDYDGDRRVSHADEIGFIQYTAGAETDLEGLAAFDTDSDGRLTASDNEWAAFGIWTDDGDGVSEPGEFETLDTAGVESVSLASDGRRQDIDGNTIHGESVFTRSDGSGGTVSDVGFAWVESSAGSGDGVEEGAPVDSRRVANTPPPQDQVGGFKIIESADSEPVVSDDRASAIAKDAIDSESHEASLFDFPDDEELDRIAAESIERAATMAPIEPVAPLDVDAWTPRGYSFEVEQDLAPEDLLAA